MMEIGRPELAEDPRYGTNADRIEHAEELVELVEDWTRRHTAEEVFRILEDADVPVGPIYSVTDIVEDPQYLAREMFHEGEVDGIGAVKMPGLAPKLSTTPGKVEWYGGSLGSHKEEVFGGVLELSPDEIGRLSEEGAI
jgi:crotonobetainyl-CoA:carnitine CoA-transferase CaiB-like acyl-CoA transferase